QAGYPVQLASSSQAALLLLTANPGGVGVILSDVRMPEINGLDFALEVRRAWPGIPIALMSAREPEELQTTHVALAGPPCPRKPFTHDEVVRLVEAMARSASLSPSPGRAAQAEMTGRHVGRLNGHPFVLRLSPSAGPNGDHVVVRRYW